MSREVRMLSTSAILGYGFQEASLRGVMDRCPDAIGVDGGGVDPGPRYPGMANRSAPRSPFAKTCA
jgi:hypothetical protein